jgi:hypothetical protein
MGDETVRRERAYHATITWTLPVFAASLPFVFVWSPLRVGIAILVTLVVAGLAEAFGQRGRLTGITASAVLAIAVDLVAVPTLFLSSWIFASVASG